MTGPLTSAESLESRIARAALELGFARVGFAVPSRSEQAADRLQRWLEAGHHGEMQYMRGELDRGEPRALLDSVKSVLVVAMPYGKAPLRPRRSQQGEALAVPLTGRVASYAQGEDYHR
ncbi:MAG TPA: QueG-associated DUF1730 domain-containing protein, partial [Polyangiaceae bacterium]|nr:QueG-associated DUF1730 domain-containing protein [Polyangiaceae bacterium]